MQIRRLASAVSVAGALALAVPAMAQESGHDYPPSPCPKGYTPVVDPLNGTGADDNGNGVVCGKATTSGDIFVDDRP
jgi:hypothetical protein